MLMGLTDSVMIGRVGSVPLAASAFAGTIYGIFFIVGIGLLLPVAVMVARSRGAGEAKDCAQYLRHGAVIAVIFGLLETLLMLAIGGHLERFGQPPEVVAEAGTYFSLIAWSLVPTLLFQVFRQFAESLGHPRIPMVVLLAAVAVNVGLNWIFIYGHWGVPAYGLAGAGWGHLDFPLAGRDRDRPLPRVGRPVSALLAGSVGCAAGVDSDPGHAAHRTAGRRTASFRERGIFGGGPHDRVAGHRAFGRSPDRHQLCGDDVHVFARFVHGGEHAGGRGGGDRRETPAACHRFWGAGRRHRIDGCFRGECSSSRPVRSPHCSSTTPPSCRWRLSC
jgi:hypothetical protein